MPHPTSGLRGLLSLPQYFLGTGGIITKSGLVKLANAQEELGHFSIHIPLKTFLLWELKAGLTRTHLPNTYTGPAACSFQRRHVAYGPSSTPTRGNHNLALNKENFLKSDVWSEKRKGN